ncbi:MAG: hypothetical protein WCT52_04125 [Candidatus Micrarchaeia archaeon]
MVSLKKYVLCKCGASNSFDFSSDMQVEDITVSARCQSCSATVHVSISAMLSAPSQPAAPSPMQADQSNAQQAAQEASEPSMMDNLDNETKENVEQAVRDLFR